MKTIYLDKFWQEVTKDKSYFYRYEYRFNDIPYEPIYQDYKNCTFKSSLNTDSIVMGQPIILNGDFYWYNKKNKLIGECHYKNGNSVGIEKNYRHYFFFSLFYSVRICEIADFNKKHPNFNYSYYYTEYRFNGKVKFEGYYRNGDKNVAIYEFDY